MLITTLLLVIALGCFLMGIFWRPAEPSEPRRLTLALIGFACWVAADLLTRSGAIKSLP